jgi:hypothetical protein
MGHDYMKAEAKSPRTILDKYTALLDISCRLNPRGISISC